MQASCSVTNTDPDLVPDSNSPSGRDGQPDTAAIMIDRHDPDLRPNFAILHMVNDQKPMVKEDISKGFETIDYEKLIEPKKFQQNK
jgi:hypothetical protein